MYFFGHRDYTGNANEALEATIENLILYKGVDKFLIGNNGNFDLNVISILGKLQKQYPHIKCYIVISHISDNKYALETILPEGIENIPKRFSVDNRNKWMVEKCDYVIAYVTRSYGGAAKFAALAEKKNRKVVNIG